MVGAAAPRDEHEPRSVGGTRNGVDEVLAGIAVDGVGVLGAALATCSGRPHHSVVTVDEVVPLRRAQTGDISDDGIPAAPDDVSSLVFTPNDGIDVTTLRTGVLGEVPGDVSMATNDEDSICCHASHPRTDKVGPGRATVTVRQQLRSSCAAGDVPPHIPRGTARR